MKLFLSCLLLLSFFCTIFARPQYKDIDYRLYDEGRDSGVAVDAVYELVHDKPPDSVLTTVEPTKHHHHHHHKKLEKTNRLDRLKRFLRAF